MTERNGRPGRRYDDMPQQNQSPVVTDDYLHGDLISELRNGDSLAARLDAADLLEAALPSGVRVKPCDPRECICSPDDDPPVECPFPQPRGTVNIKPLEWLDMGEGPRCITVCGMYAIHPSSGTNGKPTLTLTGMPGNLFGKFATVEEAKAAAQADYERRVLSAIEPTPSPCHAETVAPYAAALRMIRDAVGELFGPVSDLESEEAVLLRGPEPHHEAEAIIAGMQRVKECWGAPAPAELEVVAWLVVINEKFNSLHWTEGEAANCITHFNNGSKHPLVRLSDAQAAVAAKDGGWERAWLEQKRAEAAEARVADLEKALVPFDSFAEYLEVETEGFSNSDELEVSINGHHLYTFKVSDFRAARATLHPEREG